MEHSTLVQRKEIYNTLRPVLLKKYKRIETFLNYRSVWELLVAVILSAQMTDEGVNAMTPELFTAFPTIKSMAEAPIASIRKYVKRVNYYNAKSQYLKKTAQLLHTQYNDQVPDSAEALMTLPGVGRKTAVAVLANGFNKYVGIAVDTHVIRFAHRFKLSAHSDASQIEKDLLQIIPKRDWNAASYAIKEYGRKEGRARRYDQAKDPLWALIQKKNCVL